MLHKILITSFVSLYILLISPASYAIHSGYSKVWYESDSWYGDFPHGFAVVGAKTVVPMHVSIMRNVGPSLKCQLPQYAVFHVWNVDRSIPWVTWSKIIPLTIKETFSQTTYDKRGKPLQTKFVKNETMEYLVYEDEDFAVIRYHGVEMDIDQAFLSKVSDHDDVAYMTKDEWFFLKCENGVSGWILYRDMFDSSGRLLSGLNSWTLGLASIGEVHDLHP